MSNQVLAKPGSTSIPIPFSVKNGTRQLVDADALPTVTQVTVNGVDTSVTATVAQVQDSTPANVTGQYQVDVDGSAFVDKDTVVVYLSAIVGGTQLNDYRTINVINTSQPLPFID